MAEGQPPKFRALVRRELQEYRSSLCWTPLVLVLLLGGFMLGAVLLADQISALREAVLQLLPGEVEPGSRVSIRIDDSSGEKPVIEYRVEKPFTPYVEGEEGTGTDSAQREPQVRPGQLNPLLLSLHNLFLLILILVCANYLLATLFTDRRDRSILFWKSMPVSDREEVLAKYAVAMLVAPAIYFAASLLAQALGTLLGMLLLWRMEMDPYAALVDKLDFLTLFGGQLAAWPLMSLWLAPTYAWLLLASAGATRSPFMLAITPILALLLGERILLGSAGLAAVLSRHFPQLGSSAGAYGGFYWQGLADLPSLCLGLLFAGLALWLAVFLRRYYFEL